MTLQKTQRIPAIAHCTPRDDFMIIACLLAVCIFGIWGLGSLGSAPQPATVPAEPQMAAITPEVSEVPEAVVQPAPEAPEPTPSAPPAAPLPPPQRTVTAPVKRRPVLSTSPGFITLLGDTHNDAFFYRSAYSNPTGHYGGDWSRRNITNTAEGADLEVRREASSSGPYTGAEMKTLKTYGYGRYEVVMRPAKGSGLVSSFFTYTGKYEGTSHDEIDIEFLGADTTRIHFNYFRRGKTGESATFDLPFDAADADHLYAFDWTPEGITWYVDGTPYYKTLSGDPQLPRTAGSVIFNVWTGKPFMASWHGKPTFEAGAAAHYSCVSFSPLDMPSRACSDLFLPRRPKHVQAVTAQLASQPTP